MNLWLVLAGVVGFLIILRIFRLTLFRSKYLISTAYKSGTIRSAWFYKWNKESNGQWTWEACSQADDPIVYGVDEIESVWRHDYRLSVWDYVRAFRKWLNKKVSR